MRSSYYRFLRIFGNHPTLDNTIELFRNQRAFDVGQPGTMTLTRLFREIRWS